MLKRKIKIILIGLSSVVFLGLMYSLFSTQSEIISDESLRIEEPVMPGLESQIERAAKVSMNRSRLTNGADIELSVEGKSVDQSPVETVSELPESVVNEPVTIESAVSQDDLVESVNPFTDDSPQLVAKDSDAAPSQDEFITIDSVITADTTEFLDLNEATPVKKEMMLTKRDQLIVDEINQDLSKYTLHDSKPESIANDEQTIELSPEELDKSEEADKSEGVTASDESPKRPSVFAMPDIDESLMQGDDEISQQYRVTMSKLISINSKLRAADEENAELRTQFEISVSQNRQMAQIIRDIDNQIKAFTLTN